MVAADVDTLSPSQHDHRLVVGKRNAREKLSTCLNCVIQETAEQLSADSTSPPFIASGERKATLVNTGRIKNVQYLSDLDRDIAVHHFGQEGNVTVMITYGQ